MSVRALSPPGAQPTAEPPRGEPFVLGVARVPVDRVTFSTEGWARSPGTWQGFSSPPSTSGTVSSPWPVDLASAVELLPMLASRGATPTAQALMGTGGGAGGGEDVAEASLDVGDTTATPPTVADRARSAAHARVAYGQGSRSSSDAPVGESSRSGGLDSPPDTPERRDGSGRAPEARPPRAAPGGDASLSAEQQLLVEELRVRDRQVRSHEAAHQATGGALAGAAAYSYQRGPDGKSYAVGGEVSIDLSSGSSPRETIERARQVRAAALAPADPSGQDLRVAAAAAALELAATMQLAEEQRLAHASARSTHVHGAEPCATCARASASYKAAAS